jgi:membrane-associated protein
MEWLAALIDFILHIDVHLEGIIRAYGTWTYAILFAIVFVETGLVIMPLLPGDSLLFAAGTFAARGWLNPGSLTGLLILAAVLGDTVNYWIGHFLAPRISTGRIRFINRKHLARTHEFFERHGGKTIVLARFIPIVRTFAPFVAGVGAMDYGRFLAFNVGGAIVWVTLFVWAGYYFGNIPTVEENFTLVIMAIIVLSVLPGVVEWARARWRRPSPR